MGRGKDLSLHDILAITIKKKKPQAKIFRVEKEYFIRIFTTNCNSQHKTAENQWNSTNTICCSLGKVKQEEDNDLNKTAITHISTSFE
jgi:hypothetical protein